MTNFGKLALPLGAAALAAVAFVAFAAPRNAADASAAVAEAAVSAVDLNRNLTAAQASYGLRYQCMQDFRQCTRDIAVSSAWTADLAQQVFDGEYAACCYEAELCGDFLNSLGNRALVRDYDDDIASACAVINDAQAALHSTHATLMRKVKGDAVR